MKKNKQVKFVSEFGQKRKYSRKCEVDHRINEERQNELYQKFNLYMVIGLTVVITLIVIFK